ncbi:hypothetical protein CBOM_08127 [Ceraceosorus bombacis]|uniref:Uncharacterized protein n=1 Tax=Ceraceosorus bombacis TaxID=401625 RepID=A0A0P1B8F6_9BASI|nr:hypothetical protein CBOM_08127 [Ceraceosorus bombacis]
MQQASSAHRAHFTRGWTLHSCCYGTVTSEKGIIRTLWLPPPFSPSILQLNHHSPSLTLDNHVYSIRFEDRLDRTRILPAAPQRGDQARMRSADIIDTPVNTARSPRALRRSSWVYRCMNRQER